MKKLILLVEDDLPIIDIYTKVLEKSGFDVETVNLGKGAIERIKKIKTDRLKKPDLIILDLVLPDISGIDALKEIRKTEGGKTIPVLIFTNYSNPELEKNGYNLGAEKYLLKTDYTPNELVQTVEEMLKKEK